MPVSVPEFWKLLAESRLASADQLVALKEKFTKVKGADTQSNSSTLAEWLVANGVLSRYQAKVLTAGRPGPFRFGSYVVYDRHSGPFKGVFKAIHPTTKHQVVLAFFTGQATQNPHWWSIIIQQIAILTRAVHPHLCRVYQLCDTGSYKFAVLEYVRGNSAAERLKSGPPKWPEACRIARQVALGLTKLLEVGQLHNEIRPANIWIDRQENSKLLLPPLARDPLALPGPITLTAADDWLALAADYLAPELTQPGQAPNACTEVYSLGCTLYELIAGTPPYPNGDLSAKLRAHATQSVPVLDAMGVPPAVAHVLASMTARNPALRYQHPKLAADALTGVLQQFDQAQLAHPLSPNPATTSAFQAWLDAQPITPPLPDAVTPPAPDDATEVVDELPNVFAGRGPQIAASPTVPSSPAFELSQAPFGADTLATSSLDPIAAMAGANAPAAEPTFNFEGLDGAPAPVVDIPLVTGGAVEDASAGATSEKTAPTVAEVLRGRRQRKRRNVAIAVAVVSILSIVGGVWYLMNRPSVGTTEVGGGAPNGGEAKSTSASNQGENSSLDAVNASGIRQVADDGETLWLSPTDGKPLSLDYLAPATQALLFLRPAELVEHPEGAKVLAALGPGVEAARESLESIAGPLEKIEQLVVAWVDPLTADSTAAGGWPTQVMWIARYTEPPNLQALKERWGNPVAVEEANETTYSTPLGTAYLPSKDKGRTLVVGPSEIVKRVIASSGAAPPIRLELKRLLPTTDDQRLATFLFVPDMALAEGATLFSDPLASAIGSTSLLATAEVRGVSLSAHFAGESLFLECRQVQSGSVVAQADLDAAKQQMAETPMAVERAIAAMNPAPYGRLVLLRFPQMVKLLSDFTRVGFDHDDRVLRAYLPAVAAHNLALGAELALAESGGSGGMTTSGLAHDGPKGETPSMKTVAERLQQRTSLVFDRDTLEKAVLTLADDIGVQVEILGSDLQIEGITKNQSFGLAERDKPAGEILRNIMLKANPDGKLVYVIKPAPSGGQETLVITTRAAAAKRGDRLPTEFTAGSP